MFTGRSGQDGPSTEAARGSQSCSTSERAARVRRYHRNGRPAGVVLSSEEYEALAETAPEVLEDEAALEALSRQRGRRPRWGVYSLNEVRPELGLAHLRLTRRAR